MSDNDLFKKDKEATDNDKKLEQQEPNQNNTQTSYDPLLGMIVNSSGEQKYSSVEEALKGANHANTHIAKLEQELKDLREDKEKQPKLDDIITAIQSQNTPDKDTSGNSEDNKLTATDIQAMVEQTINNNNLQATREQNITKVTGKFKELYGDKASETLYGKANDLGMSQEDINSLISTNPTAVFRMLGIDEKVKENVNMDAGDVNSQDFQQKAPEQIPSSMGYLTSKELLTNWRASAKRTLDKRNTQ